jgi:flagellar biosynthesis protein FlhF
MKLRKFTAATMRDAVAEVRRELGPDAMVVATRQVRRGLLATGVEVTAAVDDEPQPSGPTTWSAEPAPAPVSGSALTDVDVERITAPLRAELRSLRSMLRPLETRRAQDELRGELRGELSALRQAVLSGRAAASDPRPLGEIAGSAEIARGPDKRVIALVGPTGVGKTTTIAKLAARAALVERRAVGIVTLDTYRVGGEEQIRAYADLIGVPLHLVADPARLAPTVASLRDLDRVYVDTAGRSPRDAESIEVLRAAFASVADLEVHLALAAGARPTLIDDCARRYRSLGFERLLFTKLDEADDLSEVVRAPARIGRPVSFLTTGQRVPEDLEDATAERLLVLAERGFAEGEVAA